MFKISKGLQTVLILCLFIAGSQMDARADDTSAAERAGRFLGNPAQGKFILSYLHMGAEYKRHYFRGVSGVNDSAGITKAGYFALFYEFHWEDDGVTDIAFLCNDRGQIYDAVVTYTNAVASQPYLFANLGLTALGDALVESLQNQLTGQELDEVSQLVASANSKRLMIFGLRARQISSG